MPMAYIYLIIVALIAAGSLAVAINSRRILKQTLKDLRLELQQQIDALSAKVGAVERPWVQSDGSVLTRAGTDEVEPGAFQMPEEITAETLAKIADTVAALLGRRVRIRSVRIVEQEDAIVNPWAQQGRVVIHASHNFAQRARE
jgi:type II secretory pathway pseudopilin PulG